MFLLVSMGYKHRLSSQDVQMCPDVLSEKKNQELNQFGLAGGTWKSNKTGRVKGGSSHLVSGYPPWN